MALRDHNELDVILAVIVGGTAFSGGKFNLFGSLIGALTMRTLILQVQAAGLNWGYALVPQSGGGDNCMPDPGAGIPVGGCEFVQAGERIGICRQSSPRKRGPRAACCGRGS